MVDLNGSKSLKCIFVPTSIFTTFQISLFKILFSDELFGADAAA